MAASRPGEQSPRVERPSMESSGVLFTAEEVERARRYHRTRPTSEKVVKAFAVSSGFGPYFAVTHGSGLGREAYGGHRRAHSASAVAPSGRTAINARVARLLNAKSLVRSLARSVAVSRLLRGRTRARGGSRRTQ